MVSDENFDAGDSARPNRRNMLKTAAAVTGTALWVTPTVLALSATPAAASTCACGGATTSAALLAQRTAQTGTPTSCSIPANGSASLATFCRSDSTHRIYLWGTGSLATGTNGPMLDDIGILAVTDQLSVVRYGNIYRFQNFCRQGGGTNIPATVVPAYTTASQRVYTNAAAPNIWDFLPPQPANGLNETLNPQNWWNASQPNNAGTNSVGNPGYNAPATPWTRPIDVTPLFGNRCGVFTITFANHNRYQEYKWSNIFIGSTPPVFP